MENIQFMTKEKLLNPNPLLVAASAISLKDKKYSNNEKLFESLTEKYLGFEKIMENHILEDLLGEYVANNFANEEIKKILKED